MYKKITILLFNKNNVSIVKKKEQKIIYIYNSNFYFIIILKNSIFFFFEKYSNYFIIYFLKTNILNKIINKYLNKLFYSWNNFFFKKIKFSGKGYKIKKSNKKKNIKFFFNRSHFNVYLFKKEFLKKIRKTKFLLIGSNFKKLNNNIKILLAIRPVNLYTKKGLRLSRCIMYKKASKKGVSL